MDYGYMNDMGILDNTPFLSGNYRKPSVGVCLSPHLPQPLIHVRGTPQPSSQGGSVGFQTF